MKKEDEVKKCPICGRSVSSDDFKEYPLVFSQEFKVSGMCPVCQLNTFKPEPDEVCGWWSWQGYHGEKPVGSFCAICVEGREDLRNLSDCQNLNNGLL